MAQRTSEREHIQQNIAQRSNRTPAWRRALRESGIVYGLASLLVAATVWFTFQFIEPAPPRILSIATGGADGAYRGFGERLAAELAKHDVELTVVETEGSVDNLQRLSANDVDIAFLQSGLAKAGDYPELESLGALYYEPLWIFTRESLQISRLRELIGMRIAAGGAGSGTRGVALRLLADNGIAEQDVELNEQSGSSAVDALLGGSVDAVISVASVSAPMIKSLLRADGIHLVSLARASAYSRREPWLTHLQLPEGVIDLARNIPTQTIDLLAVNATLVTLKSLHPALRDLILQASDSVFSDASVLSDFNQFPRAEGSDFQVAAAAERYYEQGAPFLQRYLPFWVANLVDRLKLLALPLIALLLPLSRLLPPAYRWSVRKKIYRWYDEVQQLDQAASDEPTDSNLNLCLGELLRIENEVREVEVPLGYAHELYGLRQHIELLLRQIDQRLANNKHSN